MLTFNQQIIAALEACINEMAEFSDDAVCDHAVGICWCSYHRTIEHAQYIIDKLRLRESV